MSRVYYLDPQSYNNLSIYDYSLLKGMHGHDIVYYCSSEYQLSETPGCRQKFVFNYHVRKSAVGKSLSYAASMCGVLRDVLRERPEVIHIQWIRLWPVDYIFALICGMVGVKLVFTAHNISNHNPGRMDRFMMRAYYRRLSTIIVHTERSRGELADKYHVNPDIISVIPHGLLPSMADGDMAEKRLAELIGQLNIRQGDIVFSCLGYQYDYKGIDLIAEVWRNNPELNGNSHLHLLIVGRNRNVREEVFASIRGFGNVMVSNEQLDDVDFEAFLRLSSVILLPYKEISQSGLLLSAMNSKVPVLVSDVGGLTEPLRYGRVGWCIGEPTYENLRRWMLYLTENAGEISDVRHDDESFSRVHAEFSWERISERTSLIYSALAESRR